MDRESRSPRAIGMLGLTLTLAQANYSNIRSRIYSILRVVITAY